MSLKFWIAWNPLQTSSLCSYFRWNFRKNLNHRPSRNWNDSAIWSLISVRPSCSSSHRLKFKFSWKNTSRVNLLVFQQWEPQRYVWQQFLMFTANFTETFLFQKFLRSPRTLLYWNTSRNVRSAYVLSACLRVGTVVLLHGCCKPQTRVSRVAINQLCI